ncbi:hypothetical protein [Agromyces albus]|uniref:hypothetical protein n=1 Tax=Agromyces albus TaxID=205332 RepID=UPI00277D3DC2|nr:hypothetical protein [Agromyces albus]MDQ0576469.1 hypothetical protein [Agromyces albus]
MSAPSVSTGVSGDGATVVILEPAEGDAWRVTPAEARRTAVRLIEAAHRIENPVEGDEWP